MQFKSVDFHICSLPFNSVSCITGDKNFPKSCRRHFYSEWLVSKLKVIISVARRFILLGHFIASKGIMFLLRALLLMGASHVLWGKNRLPQLEDLSRELTENLFSHLGKRMFPIRTVNLSWLTFLQTQCVKFLVP